MSSARVRFRGVDRAPGVAASPARAGAGALSLGTSSRKEFCNPLITGEFLSFPCQRTRERVSPLIYVGHLNLSAFAARCCAMVGLMLPYGRCFGNRRRRLAQLDDERRFHWEPLRPVKLTMLCDGMTSLGGRKAEQGESRSAFLWSLHGFCRVNSRQSAPSVMAGRG